MVRKDGITAIQVSTYTRDFIKNLGHKGESYDDILVRELKIPPKPETPK